MPDHGSFPEPLRQLAAQTLGAGERVLWAGRPSPACAFWAAAPIWFFAAPWTLFSLFWEVMAFGGAMGAAGAGGMPNMLGLAFFLFGLPFVLIGVVMLAAPFAAARAARASGYLVTDRRLLALRTGRTRTIKSLDPAAIRGVAVRLDESGRGTVSALGLVRRDVDGDKTSDDMVMIGVDAPQAAERAIAQLLRASR